VAYYAPTSMQVLRATAYAIARICHRPSVCLSVCLSVTRWISQKRLKLRSCNFHHTVAPSVWFLRDKFYPESLTGSARVGGRTMVGWGKQAIF